MGADTRSASALLFFGAGFFLGVSVWAQGVNCSFRTEPYRFLAAEARAYRETNARISGLKRHLSLAAEGQFRTISANEIPRRNYIDNVIFDKIQQRGVRTARLTTDQEFVRRIHLDLTGRIPTPDQVRAFIDDQNPRKRDALIDSLLHSSLFTDKWMLWLGDLMQNAAANSTQSIQIGGRNAFYRWLRKSLDQEKPLRDLVWEVMVMKGNSFNEEVGAAAWHVRSRTPGGPLQDTYDTAFSRAATQFLGIAHYDCVLCHNGRGHLDELSLWGKSANRTEAQRMAAFFSRQRFARPTADQSDPLYLSSDVYDLTAGAYDLNTTFGNRPNRQPIGTVRSLTPEYRGGQTPSIPDWRGAFADFLVHDKQFAINLANRIWKQIFNLGLVEPVDQMDPARLDPKASLPDGRTLQATHPELLIALAENLEGLNFSLREFVRLLVSSSAYQLSSQYDEAWKLEYVPLFARHYPRRLEGEEVHDAIQAATGVLGTYTVQGWAEPVRWAIQLPEPVEPRSNGGVNNFMNSFLRGNRDTVERSQQGSILQQLNLMNDNAVVLSRIRVVASPTVRKLAEAADIPAGVEEIYLTFLSRKPSASELAKTVRYIESLGASQRTRSAEDVAWSLINRSEFIFSY